VPGAGESLAVARLEPTTQATAGQSHTLGLHPETIHLFDARTGRNLVVGASGNGAGRAQPAAEEPVTPSAAQPQPEAQPEPEATQPEATQPGATQPESESSGGDTTRLS
jgi:hypothetical protein